MQMTLTAACTTVQGDAICERSLQARDAHNIALIADGGPWSKMTGAYLLDLLDQGCRQ